MSLDRGVACSGAEEAAGEDVAACTGDGVCASPSGALGEGKETWGWLIVSLLERRWPHSLAAAGVYESKEAPPVVQWSQS